MPRLKVDDFDIEELEAAEYNQDFERYTGKQPPKGTVLAGYIKKAWWTYSQADNPMLVLLFVADGNEGPEAKYNGLPVWERLVFISSAKFRWKPFIDLFGITLRDIKTRATIEADEDNIGAPIIKIASWKPGEDQACRIITKREQYNDDWTTKVDVWLPLEDEEDPQDYEDEEEDEELEDDEELEEEGDDEELEEEDEEPEPAPARKRPTTAAKPSARPAPGKVPAKRPAAATAKSATPARRTATPAKPARTGTAKRPAGKPRGYDDEPPF